MNHAMNQGGFTGNSGAQFNNEPVTNNNFSQPSPVNSAPNSFMPEQRAPSNNTGRHEFNNPPQVSDSSQKSSREEFGRQHAIYSGQASIKFYAATDKNGDFTMNIEAAKKNGGSFDWGGKTTFQLMQKELGLLIAFLYGFTEIAVFDNHGSKIQPKSMTLKAQPDKGNFYISLSEKDKGMKGSQFDYADAMIIASMALSQMRKTFEFKSTEELLKMVKHFIVQNHLPPLKAGWLAKQTQGGGY